MAEPNKLPSVVRNERQAAHIDPVKAGARHAERLISQFTKRAGLGEGAADALGHIAGQFAEGLASHFTQIFAEKGGVPTNELSKAYKQLGKLHDVDKFVAAPPATVTHDNGLIDGRTFKILDSEQRGLHRAEGSIAKSGHAVGQVFDKLGLDMKGFDGEIADILDLAGSAKKNLGDKQNWITIVGQMAAAAFGTGGDIKQRAAAALQAGVQGVTSAATKPVDVIDVTPKVIGTETGTKTGLENHAPKTSNTGSASGAMAVRAQLLSGLKSQDDQVERTAGKVLGDVFRHLDVDPDKATKRKLHGELRALMADGNSPTGKTDVVKLLDRVIGRLADKNPDNDTLQELNGFLQKAIAQDPEFVANEGVHEALGTLAADGIAELVAGELGVETPSDSKLNGKLLNSLEELLPKPKETEVGGDTTVDGGHAAEPEPLDLSAWTKDRSDIPQQFREGAIKILGEMGLPMDHPMTAAMTNAIAEVMQGAIDPNTNALSEADFAVNLQSWLVQNGGASEEVFAGMYQQLANAMSVHSQTVELFNQKKERYQTLQAQQTGASMRQNTQALEGELTTLHNDMTMLSANVQKGEKFLLEQIGMLQRDGLNRMRMMFFEGKAPGDGIAAGQNAAQGGGAVPPGGGVPPGGVPPGGQPPGGVPPGGGGPHNYFDRGGATTMGNVPGILSGGRPEDLDNDKNLTIQQERAMKCGEVLADPSLCIEDKIFLFMMWFTAFTDRERESKLEELVQMDRETARNQKLKDEKQSELKNLTEQREVDANELVQAQAKVDSLEKVGGGGAELEQAQAAVDACKEHLAARDAKIRGVEHQLSDLNVKNDKAPKSREVLFMEIERLNQLRDKIMNMARSIMENSNRAIEKIFR